jgi:hypothetical protein
MQVYSHCVHLPRWSNRKITISCYPPETCGGRFLVAVSNNSSLIWKFWFCFFLHKAAWHIPYLLSTQKSANICNSSSPSLYICLDWWSASSISDNIGCCWHFSF